MKTVDDSFEIFYMNRNKWHMWDEGRVFGK